ncbi:MAG: hypothetical protein M5U35_17185 [Roseovarius sp.]|nr:hypothetical protein [Roseovarius sp.]
MLAVKTNVESLTGKPMQVFGCKYFSYDENTVKAAEALGVPYVLGRGTEDIRALIHKPEEYDVGIIKVSNVEFSGMGRGSLCDISLYWRGATDADFADMVKASLAQSPRQHDPGVASPYRRNQGRILERLCRCAGVACGRMALVRGLAGSRRRRHAPICGHSRKPRGPVSGPDTRGAAGSASGFACGR